AAAAASNTLAETYEAQTVRALNEIDRTLKFIAYDYERLGDANALEDLRRRELLPPSLIFAVGIVDREGRVVTGTAGRSGDLSGQDIFESARTGDSLVVGVPIVEDGEPRLRFSRRLTRSGEFDGIVMIEVDAAYFVSGYDEAKLGAHGVLGIVG